MEKMIENQNFDRIPSERIKNKGIKFANYLCCSCKYILTHKGSKICTSCREIFCAVCIEDINSNNTNCLICKQESYYIDCPKNLINILGDLEITCRYENCSAKVFYSDINEHEVSCFHQLITCNFCKREIELKDEESHKEICNERFMICLVCGFKDRPEYFDHSCNVVRNFSSAISEMKRKIEKTELFLEEEKNKNKNLNQLCDKLYKELIEVKSNNEIILSKFEYNIKSINERLDNGIMRMNESEKIHIKVMDLFEVEKIKNEKLIIDKCHELLEKYIIKNNNYKQNNGNGFRMNYTMNNLSGNPFLEINNIINKPQTSEIDNIKMNPQLNPFLPLEMRQIDISNIPHKSVRMSDEEVFLYDTFKKYIPLYNSRNMDETKQKDFLGKMIRFLNKLTTNEIHVNLLKLLIEFSNLFDAGANQSELKKLYLKIQSIGWDQNKNWMTIIERLINSSNSNNK